MSEIDNKLAESVKHIAETERQANALKHAAQYRPSAVSDEDVVLAEQLAAGWKTLRASLAKHPEFQERARELELKQATGRTGAKNEK
ncbi:hypothetical protein [Hyphomicrobium facile]|uniref:Uncharacterized protein n=1 Tax=Hyphomicrobium facile TaxID=51670 RepID=A0A1I7NTF8_9HYPH|nr:hypothetical protein [Hyphomicrobium facile]SFV37934.1 hypothetical protein SAMN04488557_3411 [Hyphomicrobium facile]